MDEIRPIMGACLRIPKALLDVDEIRTIRADLTFAPKQGGGFGFSAGRKPLLAYDDRGEWMTVPRGYGVGAMRRINRLRGVEVIDRTSIGEQVDFEFNEERQKQKPALKAAQDRMVNKTVRALRNGRLGGVVSAPCGSGKTVVGLKIAAELGRTTLVLVHKEFLLNQWAERIEEWLGIPRDDVGIVRQDRCEYEGRKIVIAMVQSLCEREYDPGLYTWAGLIIPDEVHRHGADLWHRSIMKFPAKYRVGLTATPDRADGMWPVIVANFGGILAQESGEAMSPTVYIVEFSPHIPLARYCWMGYGGRIKKAFLARFVNALVQHEGRNAIIVQVVAKAVREGRTVMVLTDRRAHVDNLQTMITEVVNGATVGQYVGGMSEEAREISSQCRVIVGTFAMASEGLDIPSLDVMVLATPHSNVEQAIGRICRHRVGKKSPVVVDIVDDERHICSRMAQKRMNFFYQRNWPVRYV